MSELTPGQVLVQPRLGRIHVYPVGFYDHLNQAWRKAMLSGQPWRAVARLARDVRRNWRRRTYWNGFLAEPTRLPDGLARCGRGWTRVGAMRSLARELARCADA